MSIIRCPNCKHQISSRAPSCSHCGHSMGSATLNQAERQEAQEVFLERKLRRLRSRLDLGAVAAATLLALVFLAWWLEGSNAGALTQQAYAYAMAVLAMAYVALRVWKLVIRKR